MQVGGLRPEEGEEQLPNLLKNTYELRGWSKQERDDTQVCKRAFLICETYVSTCHRRPAGLTPEMITTIWATISPGLRFL
jgi:hypothetical protein